MATKRFRVLTGDSLKLLKKLPAESVDSCVCDPPYGLEFMGKETKIRTKAQSKNGVQRESRRNNHPTVKPTALMRYLCKLVTPKGGTVLDPFTGSGSTGKAAVLEGFSFIGCELSKEYSAIAKARISAECSALCDRRSLAGQSLVRFQVQNAPS